MYNDTCVFIFCIFFQTLVGEIKAFIPIIEKSQKLGCDLVSQAEEGDRQVLEEKLRGELFYTFISK